MTATVASIWRYPVKGFTPERLPAVRLAPDGGFPHDRVYAVENGPSGFDPAHPAFVPKQKFTVLASTPRVAVARTRYDEATRTLRAEAPGLPAIDACLADPAGKQALADWIARLIGEDSVRGPLKVVEGPGHRFTDNPLGQVSIVNLASVRDLGRAMGRQVDPLRFRANLYVEGWPAWAENDWIGRALEIGGITASVFKPIVRCLATHVDPVTAEVDLDISRALFDNYGHLFCGVYVHVRSEGEVRPGDACPPAQDVTEPAA